MLVKRPPVTQIICTDGFAFNNRVHLSITYWCFTPKHVDQSLGLGRYSQYRYSIDTDINRYVSIRPSCCTDTDDGDSCKKTTNIPNPKQFVSHMIFIPLIKNLKHIDFDLNYVDLLICGKKSIIVFKELVFVWFTVKINPKHLLCCLNPKFLILKSLVVYMCIVSNTYRIGKDRIDTADDRIVPALWIIISS